jgi:ABC-2 type transport system permease protein
VVQFSILPLNFISNVFINMQGAPAWIDWVSKLFPIRHFADALLGIYNNPAAGSGFAPNDLLVIAAWGVVGLVIALRFFSWEPHR